MGRLREVRRTRVLWLLTLAAVGGVLAFLVIGSSWAAIIPWHTVVTPEEETATSSYEFVSRSTSTASGLVSGVPAAASTQPQDPSSLSTPPLLSGVSAESGTQSLFPSSVSASPVFSGVPASTSVGDAFPSSLGATPVMVGVPASSSTETSEPSSFIEAGLSSEGSVTSAAVPPTGESRLKSSLAVATVVNGVLASSSQPRTPSVVPLTPSSSSPQPVINAVLLPTSDTGVPSGQSLAPAIADVTPVIDGVLLASSDTHEPSGLTLPPPSSTDVTAVINAVLPPSTAVVEPEISDGSATRFNLVATSSSVSALSETLSAVEASLENVTVSGDLEGVVNFTSYERVTIDTGAFAGKGFAKGELVATLAGLSFDGHWRAFSYFSPGELRVYLKGAVYGNIGGITEGYLMESTPGSGVYDQYHSMWRLTHVGSDPISATVELEGTLVYGDSSEFPSTQLLAYQESFEGTAEGAYTGPMSAVLTRVSIDEAGNPYDGEGFSLVSHNSGWGAGEGWTHNKAMSDTVELNGLFLDPLTGAVSGVLDEGASPKTLTGAIARIDVAPPEPDLRVNVLAPQRASPGQTVSYVIEYRNDGWADAPQALVFNRLDESVRLVSGSPGAFYNPGLHMVAWDVGQVAAKTNGSLTLQAEIKWGLPQGTSLEHLTNIVHITTEPPPPPSRVVYVNGIGNCGPSLTKNLAFSGELNAYWAVAYHTHCYGLPGWFTVPDDVVFDVLPAKANIATEGNALNDPLLNNQSYDECWAYSGGTVTTVTAIRRRGLRCNRLVLVSTWLWNKDDLTDLHTNYGVEDVTLYQSAADAPLWGLVGFTQLKLDPDNPADKEFLDNNSDWVDLQDKPGVKHGGWIPCFEDTFQATGVMDCDQQYLGTSTTPTTIAVARDPNAKHVDRDIAGPGETLDFTVEYENEGEGIAFGVYITDTLEPDIDASTLVLPPDEAEGRTYDEGTRTISWFIGEVGPGGKGERHFAADVRDDAPCGAEVINFATVYFPSVPETTPTNGVAVTVITPDPECDVDNDLELGDADNCPNIPNPADADGDEQDGEDAADGVDNDGDTLIDEDYEAGQEDFDDDGLGDVCDSDDDDDGLIDQAELHVGTSALNPDSDGDGTLDGAEDSDGDGLTDGAEASTYFTDPLNPDTDGDSFGKLDEDGLPVFRDGREVYIGTDPWDACPDVLGSPGACPGPSCDGDDCWPPDLDVDREADIADVLKFKPIFLIGLPCEGDPGYDRRFDLNANGCINIADVMLYKPVILTSCTP